MKAIFFILSFILCLISVKIAGQTVRKLTGTIVDTNKVAIAGALVTVIFEKDTLRTATNDQGSFNFSRIKSSQISLTIIAFGYKEFTSSYQFDDLKTLNLPQIILKNSGNMLKEVLVKAKPNPIRVMQDTVEYNVAAYQVFEGDNIADILKQFPGLEVDADYNVKTMGQELTKLRVNGKDFFTNNVKDFISKLPGLIVDKIQIIDDYGDEANFTGIKTGEPRKMLNIVTKPGMNRGKFGNLSLNGGTNDQIGSQGGINLWADSKQSGGNANYSTQNNGAGRGQNMHLSANHNDKMGKNGSVGINYSFGRNSNAFSNEQSVETSSTLGKLYNQSQSGGENSSINHNLGSNFSFNNKKLYMNGMFSLSLANTDNVNTSANNQMGFIKQDLRNQNSNISTSPRANLNLSVSKKIKNGRSFLSGNFGFSTNSNNSDQQIITNTLYYDKYTNILAKDSLLDRRIENNGNSQNFNAGFTLGMGLKKPKDTLASQSLNINYAISVAMSTNRFSTFVKNNLTHQSVFIDTLSTHTNSTSINQSLGLSYNYNNKKMRLSLGLSLRPTSQQTSYINLDRKIENNAFNYSPNINYGKTISKSKTVSINYSGSNNNPSPYQLQPVKNTQNLQNIIIGNPSLKPTFNHSISSNYNYVHNKSGMSAMGGLRFSVVQNEIVNNVIFIPDTLNSFKQETHFENVNGTYNLSGNYNVSMPIKKNKVSISYSGNIGFSNKAIFVNNGRRDNKGLNLSQGVRGNVMLKKFTLMAGLNYSLMTNNNYTIQNDFDNTSFNLGQFSGATFFRTSSYRADISSTLRLTKFNFTSNISYNQSVNNNQSVQDNFKKISTVSMSLSGSTTIRKSYRIGLNSSKTINTGYSLASSNPLLINANFSKAFLKSRALNVNVTANDLLNQGNNISRSMVGNSVIDRRTNQVSRLITFGLNYNLSRFGGNGQTFRVDADDVFH